MVSKNQSDCLPPGWKVQIKNKSGRKYKCYINTKTHQKFYSKIAVLRNLKDESVNVGEIQPDDEDAKKTSGKLQMQLVEANDSQWLPNGWTLERRIRKSGVRAGTEYKCYIDPSTKAAFYSKPEVLRYLGSKHAKQRRPGSSRQDRGGNRRSSSKIVIERTVDQDLPPGWVKESRITMLGDKVVKRNPLYLDPNPASRLVFRSKVEVLRYLETGEISRHASRRRNKSIDGDSVAIGMTPSTSSGKQEEVPKRSSRKESCAGESSTGGSIIPLSQGGCYGKAADNQNRRFSSRVRPAPSGASCPKQSILSPKSTGNSQDIVVGKPLLEKVLGTKKNVAKTKLTAPEILDTDANIATSNKSLRSSARSRGILPVENPTDAAIHGCSDGKAQSSRKKTKDRDLPSVPSRSSKRLAGVDAQITFHSLPIEYAHRGTNRMSSCTESIPSSELVPTDDKLPSVRSRSSKRLAGVDAQIMCHPTAIEHARQTTSSSIEPIPSLESVPKKEKLLSGPSRSSKRLAGVDAQITYHRIPIEHARRATNRISSDSKPISTMESVPSKLQEKHETIDAQDQNGHALQASSRKTSRAKADPCLASVPNVLQEKCSDVDMQEVVVSQEEKSCTPDVDAEIDLASQGKPSNKINDLHFTFQIEKSDTLEIDTDIFVGFEGETRHTLEFESDVEVESQEESLIKFNDLMPEEKHAVVDVNTVSVPAAQGPSNKVHDLNYGEDKNHTLYVDRETVPATQGEPLNKIDDLTAKSSFLVDLNFLQLEQAPPGFSEDTGVNVSSTTLKQSLEHPMNTGVNVSSTILEQSLEHPTNSGVNVSSTTLKQSLEHPMNSIQGSIVENTSKGPPNIEGQPGCVQRATEQPQSELCFSSPLWSDPCLEFAYKTLTGSIPFDDNLAIHDYIQHQLRTSEEGSNNQPLPDVRVPSIFRNDEAKTISQMPEDVKFSTSNGFDSQEIKQVNTK